MQERALVYYRLYCENCRATGRERYDVALHLRRKLKESSVNELRKGTSNPMFPGTEPDLALLGNYSKVSIYISPLRLDDPCCQHPRVIRATNTRPRIKLVRSE